MGDLTNLQSLDLSDNRLSGEIPQELGNLANLEWLDLSNNQLSGEVPAALGNLPNLMLLDLSCNELSDPSNLLGLYLSCEDSDGTALVALYKATAGPNWTNNTNWLSDKPLDEWHGVTTDDNGRVIELHLSANRLNGEIPAALSSLTNLQFLNFYDNELSGEIPAWLGDLSNLYGLALSDNRLNGEIPGALGGLTDLKWLALSDNRLSGEIPGGPGQPH